MNTFEHLTLEQRFLLVNDMLNDLANYKDCLEYTLELEVLKDDVSSLTYNTLLKLQPINTPSIL